MDLPLISKIGMEKFLLTLQKKLVPELQKTWCFGLVSNNKPLLIFEGLARNLRSAINANEQQTVKDILDMEDARLLWEFPDKFFNNLSLRVLVEKKEIESASPVILLFRLLKLFKNVCSFTRIF